MSIDELPASVHQSFKTAADLDAESTFFMRFLDTMHRNPAVKRNHARTVELLDLGAKSSLLDVGCGCGNYLIDVARIVDKATGLDQSEALLGIAKTRASNAEVDLELHLGDAMELPFADDTFDAARTERVLQYLPSPATGLSEMIRVVKPGGRVVATELDWDTILIDVGDVELRDAYRRMIDTTSDASGNPWMGRELDHMFRQSGLESVQTEPFTAMFRNYDDVMQNFGGNPSIERAAEIGVITSEEASALRHAIDATRDNDRFLYAMTLFTSSGTKPL